MEHQKTPRHNCAGKCRVQFLSRSFSLSRSLPLLSLSLSLREFCREKNNLPHVQNQRTFIVNLRTCTSAGLPAQSLPHPSSPHTHPTWRRCWSTPKNTVGTCYVRIFNSQSEHFRLSSCMWNSFLLYKNCSRWHTKTYVICRVVRSLACPI